MAPRLLGKRFANLDGKENHFKEHGCGVGLQTIENYAKRPDRSEKYWPAFSTNTMGEFWLHEFARHGSYVIKKGKDLQIDGLQRIGEYFEKT